MMMMEDRVYRARTNNSRKLGVQHTRGAVFSDAPVSSFWFY